MYSIKENKIIIKETKDFNIVHILECGQVFRFFKQADNSYVVYSLDKKAVIESVDNCYIITTNDVDYFINYFDLKTDYRSIKQELSKYKQLTAPIEYGYGIRILKQDLFEMIVSFVISANNNIKRIKNIIEKICAFCGKKIDDYYAFPTLDELMICTEEDFKSFGAGYRAKYLYNLCRQLKNINLEQLSNLPTKEVRKQIQNFSGVGPKVADCILLFGLSRKDVFPVDTWIAKAYKDIFKGNLTQRDKISAFLVDVFGQYSGFAQQYLFYFKREE